MPQFSFDFQHSPDSVAAMCRVRDKVVNRRRNTLFLLLFTACLFFAVLLLPTQRAPGSLLMLAGCWGFAAVRNGPRREARKVTEAMAGSFPVLHYCFQEGGFSVAFPSGTESFPYTEVSGLYEDREYFYLSMRSTVTYMFDRHAPANSDALKSFLSAAVGKDWSSPGSVLLFNLYDLLKKRKNR